MSLDIAVEKLLTIGRTVTRRSSVAVRVVKEVDRYMLLLSKFRYE
eukprot:CAMPEP_0172533302 /NCGR_PEP_ID=MMETSP1067-20121228/6057_1 /TAXON_ID=265564 ORGANISM="Thalassiosira punctigera, Strain Tpunct2005C2" /NCGR_SAMPLE_ID=MMETSP1067 /ASSEMBLY_ACC=CAM_ASM_000444 /LENGTH=44 /DNA_ID= /DNA_START= /DNA_END= /DNA_ORIENTATION=